MNNGRLFRADRRSRGLVVAAALGLAFLALVAVRPAWAVIDGETWYDTEVEARSACKTEERQAGGTWACNTHSTGWKEVQGPGPDGYYWYVQHAYHNGQNHYWRHYFYECPDESDDWNADYPHPDANCGEEPHPCEGVSGQFMTGPASGEACMDECYMVGAPSGSAPPEEFTEDLRTVQSGEGLYGYWWPAHPADGDNPEAGICEAGDYDGPTEPESTTLDNYDVDESDLNCGTFNGERVCVDSIPETGKCVVNESDGSYTCASSTDEPVDPKHDDDTQTVNITIGPQEVEIRDPDGNLIDRVTLSGGQIVDQESGLDDGTGNPQEGDDEAGGNFCDRNPELCDTDTGLEDPGPVPEETVDLSNLGDGYDGVIAASADCPAPEVLSLFGDEVTLEIPWTGFCDFADVIRPLVIGGAALASLFFAVRVLA